MFKRTLISALAVAGLSCLAQSGPIGRAIKATQVTVTPTGTIVSTNTVLQAALTTLDATVGNDSARISGLEAREVTIVKGSVTVPGGAVTKAQSGNQYTIFFNTGGDGTNGVGGSGSTTMVPGSVITWPMDEAPSGWLLCNGAAYSTNTYADLFAQIGWRYTAVEGTTFNVPDYRGRVLRGADTRISVDPGSSNRVASGVGGLPNTAGSTQEGTVADTNSADVVEARMPNTYVNWIIKYRDDTTYFMNQVATTPGTTFEASLTNGLLHIIYPESETWTITTAYLEGTEAANTGWVEASTTNRTVSGYIYCGLAEHASYEVFLKDRRFSEPGTPFRVVFGSWWVFIQHHFELHFDVPAGYEYMVTKSHPNAYDARLLVTTWKR